jgi:ATP-dependent DNA helicase RecQ
LNGLEERQAHRAHEVLGDLPVVTTLMLIRDATATPLHYLRVAVGRDDAQFRDGQLACIGEAVRGGRLLVVQRTGWGKSIVYFLATRLLRDRGAGPTLIVSPLLSLMRNQLAAAERIGLHSATINSSNTEEWETVIAGLRRNAFDVLLISPERLANDAFRQNVLVPMAGNVGLFVIDEAHCISDWGHDFRPDYRRIGQLFKLLPQNLPVLATTATANDRVVADVAAQLGEVSISRGPLVRESLRLQNIVLPDQASRMAWLAQHLPSLPGSGIVYTLTVRDAERVAEWLRLRGINAAAYHADSADRELLEAKLMNNEVKALVATVALGMGFDKPDLGFVVHYQRPGSVVHYYQQVGRAGRAVDEAFGILLHGREDDEIIDYFIRQAFPPAADVADVLSALDAAHDGLTVQQLEGSVNLPPQRLEKTLKLLATEARAPIRKEASRWYRSPVPWRFDVEKVRQLTALRHAEQQRMNEYMSTSSCLMRFLATELDDPYAADCGRCANCAGAVVAEGVDPSLVNQAAEFLRRTRVVIEPRKLWPAEGLPEHGFRGRIGDHSMEPGRALALWGDGGWAELVHKGKYEDGRFAEELVAACAAMFKEWDPAPRPAWVTCIPSRKHPNLVPDFARRLAERLRLPFSPAIEKLRDNAPQKAMENSVQQVRNLDGVFRVDAKQVESSPVLLVDDITDSRWTLTVAGALLRRAGCTTVFPLVLADASHA